MRALKPHPTLVKLTARGGAFWWSLDALWTAALARATAAWLTSPSRSSLAPAAVPFLPLSYLRGSNAAWCELFDRHERGLSDRLRNRASS
jgi:hypothetical protein